MNYGSIITTLTSSSAVLGLESFKVRLALDQFDEWHFKVGWIDEKFVFDRMKLV